MRVLIATAGVLSPDGVAVLAGRLAGADGEVVVMTVVEVPRSFLDEIRSDDWHPLSDDPGDWTTAEDAVISRYVEERGSRLTEPLVAALTGHGITPTVEYFEGADPASTIVKAAENMAADIIVLGATRDLFDETHWESVSTRVIRETERPVLVVPGAPFQSQDQD